MKNLDLYKDATWNGHSFWHGTSDIFLDSIRNTGLGAINAGRDLKLLDLLEFLYKEITRHNIDHPTLTLNKASIEATIVQSDMHFEGQLLNYRHQHTYISASALRAAIYACLNHVGSELLEKCLILLSILVDSNADPEIPQELDVLNLRQYLSIQTKPIMIEIREVPDNDLLLENGENADSTLWKMRNLFPKMAIADQFEKLQFCNFLLKAPVPPTSLKIFEVEYEGHPRDRNFDYYLTRIQ